jgi:hypothetical protein
MSKVEGRVVSLLARLGRAVLVAGAALTLPVACAQAGSASPSSEDSAGMPAASAGSGGGCTSPARVCESTCVQPDDPRFGCGAESCAPCAIPHASSNCSTGQCTLASCFDFWLDCNGDPADGCELLADPSNCGACGKVCNLPHLKTQHCSTDADPLGLPTCGVGTNRGGLPDCAAGYFDIDGDASNGCEVALADLCAQYDHQVVYLCALRAIGAACLLTDPSRQNAQNCEGCAPNDAFQPTSGTWEVLPFSDCSAN